MKNKKGISLIVLVITIIVIIILAAAVILTLGNNNVVENAGQAVYDNDKGEIKTAVSLFTGNYLSKTVGKSPFTASATDITIGTNRQVPLGSVISTTAPEDNIGWTDLGLTGKPASITSAKYNPTTGDFTFVPANTALIP